MSAVAEPDLRRAAQETEWYHTFELAPGVVTPGWFDHRGIVSKLPLPALAGRRCLDVGTFDGFWAFEMERRGAREVIGMDILDPSAWDWPVGSDQAVIDALDRRKRGGEGFEVARRALGSSVERLDCSVYDLDPERHGRFDFIYLGSLLLHLRDPVRALERVRAVCDGELLVVDAVHPVLSVLLPRTPVARLDGVGRPWWWKPNTAGLERMVWAAGFELVRRPTHLLMPRGSGQRPVPLKMRLLRSAAGRDELVRTRLGDPHAALLCRPR